MTAAARRATVQALEAAGVHWQHKRTREALSELREAWRVSLDPGLAELYELLLTDARAAPLAGHDPDAQAESWRVRARSGHGDPLELPVLLDAPWHADTPDIERLRALAGWTSDPLLAAGLARRLLLPLVPRELPGHEQLAIETIRLLAAQRDVRQLPVLEQLAREPSASAERRRQLRGAIASLEALTTVRLDRAAEAARAVFEPRANELRARAQRGAALLAEVFADPDADEPRWIYADWLASLGDPRGEFISLQLERHARGGPISTRERELLIRHAHAWAGVLHGVLGSEHRVFERGFLAAGSIEAARIDAALVSAPEWATLRSLDGHVSELLAMRGRLGRLRRLYGFLELDRFVMLRAAGRLEAVEHYECSLGDPNLRFDTPLGLRSLLVRHAFDDQLLELLASPACEGLEEFAVYYDGSPLGGWAWAGDHRERPALRARAQLLRANLPASIGRLRMIDGHTSRATRPSGCELTFERDADGALSRLQLTVHACRPLEPRAIVELLDTLPLRGLASVELGEVDASVCDREQLRAALIAKGTATGVPVSASRA